MKDLLSNIGSGGGAAAPAAGAAAATGGAAAAEEKAEEKPEGQLYHPLNSAHTPRIRLLTVAFTVQRRRSQTMTWDSVSSIKRSVNERRVDHLTHPHSFCTNFFFSNAWKGLEGAKSGVLHLYTQLLLRMEVMISGCLEHGVAFHGML